MSRSIDDHIAELGKKINQLSAAQLNSSKDFILIDCREEDEVKSGIIPGARWIPRGQLDLQIDSQNIQDNDCIVIYCAAGMRSLLAANTLSELGYKNVSSLNGGIKSWKDAGYPIIIPENNNIDWERYRAQVAIPQFGKEAQQKLARSKVLIVGAGGLGSPAALYLVAAGIGTLGLIDDDKIDVSNLQRQILHSTDRIGMRKSDSAYWTLRNLNPNVKVKTYSQRLDLNNVDSIFSEYDIVLDGSDNFQTRYLVNDACIKNKKINIHGSVFQFTGQVSLFCHPTGPCYRCVFEAPPPAELAPNCAQGGVIGAITGVIGSLEALEVIKYVAQTGESLIGKLLTYDGFSCTFDTMKIKKSKNCPICSIDPKKITYETMDSTCQIEVGHG